MKYLRQLLMISYFRQSGGICIVGDSDSDAEKTFMVWCFYLLH